MTIPDGAGTTVSGALAVARRAQREVAAALERVVAAGVGAWEGSAAELSAGLLRRLAAEATELLDSGVRACEQARAHPSGAAAPRAIG
ncbi:conserved hypothetical protein [Frankia canadensis]|uniref:Uncharacterized protein n=1 Tax=Frankia canadensis TaxID=1836972 RepID=A0A2I2L014_9ACTN|nr:hypothetical protein [Frankia canadensis]SNQ51261.1 conserved hypothetical protein [Frankia canadensis]SOU58551.1 conserved hypothetical protein [Frankia canadensis]